MKPFEKWGNHRTHGSEGVRMPHLASSHSSFTQSGGEGGVSPGNLLMKNIFQHP